nr:MAG TPA: hypothetical protein [Caudoviricetes sp.]
MASKKTLKSLIFHFFHFLKFFILEELAHIHSLVVHMMKKEKNNCRDRRDF